MAVRNDVESLLSRLGRQDLRYREFADQLGDMELWPIFEALLQDPRIVGRAQTLLDQRRETQLEQMRLERAARARAELEAQAAAELPVPAAAPTPPPRTPATPVTGPLQSMDAQVRTFLGQIGSKGPRA